MANILRWQGMFSNIALHVALKYLKHKMFNFGIIKLYWTIKRTGENCFGELIGSNI